MNVHQKWRLWAARQGTLGDRYGKLYARLVKSPAAKKAWGNR